MNTMIKYLIIDEKGKAAITGYGQPIIFGSMREAKKNLHAGEHIQKVAIVEYDHYTQIDANSRA